MPVVAPSKRRVPRSAQLRADSVVLQASAYCRVPTFGTYAALLTTDCYRRDQGTTLETLRSLLSRSSSRRVRQDTTTRLPSRQSTRRRISPTNLPTRYPAHEPNRRAYQSRRKGTKNESRRRAYQGATRRADENYYKIFWKGFPRANGPEVFPWGCGLEFGLLCRGDPLHRLIEWRLLLLLLLLSCDCCCYFGFDFDFD
jgi:hypothetical protein